MKSRLLQFNVLFRPEPEGGFTVIVPSLPGCITYGKDLQEAKTMAQDAITLYVEILLEDGEHIPSDKEVFLTSLEVEMGHKIRKRVYA